MKDWLIPGSLLALVWGFAIRQLALEWTINPQYQYGWLVPFLTVLLWIHAWKRRPSPEISNAFLACIPLWGAVALAIPVRIIQEANPDWRLLDFYFIAQAIGITAAVLDFSGGKAWLRHFAFPLIFPLLATPWPSGVEHELIQGLQRVVAEFGVEGVSWLGWSALQRGNLIVLPQGVVGVNEACSGIRSLQSTLMIAFFLGDYFSLSLLKRIGLIVLGLVVAFALNIVRVFTLIVIITLKNAEGLSQLHDPAGFMILTVDLLVLWTVSTSVSKQSSAKRSTLASSRLSIPKRWIFLLVCAWMSAEVFNQVWYVWHERNLVAGPLWTLRWPVPKSGFKEEPIDDLVRTYLRYDTGHHGTWQDGYKWDLYFFTWKPGRAAVGLAQSHRPDICLPAAGFVLKDEQAAEKIEFNGVAVPVVSYIFQDPMDGRYFYVFQAVSDDRIQKYPLGTTSLLHSGRLSMAWAGVRNPGQRSFLIIIQGASNAVDAKTEMRQLLQDDLSISGI